MDLVVIDTDGNEVAATVDETNYKNAVGDFVKSPADSQEFSNYQFFKIYDEQVTEYILVVIGTSEDTYMIGKRAAFQLQGLMVAYKERFDKDNFIKNLLLDNLLLVDIYSRSKKLHIMTEAKRTVMIVEPNGGKDNNALEIVRNFMGTGNKDFITAVDENSVVIVKEISEVNFKAEIERTAVAIKSLLEKEGVSKVHVSYGNIVGDIKEVSRSYKEAKMALDRKSVV